VRQQTIGSNAASLQPSTVTPLITPVAGLFFLVSSGTYRKIAPHDFPHFRDHRSEGGFRMKKPKSMRRCLAASGNATTHGVFTSSVVLRNENDPAFAALVRDYTEHYAPVGPSERKLVDELAVCEWRQRRVWAAETAGLDVQIDEDAPALAKSYEKIDEPVRTATAIKNLSTSSSFLDLMRRYETAFSRQYDRALRRLLAFQDLRKRQLPPSQPSAEKLQNETGPLPRPSALPQSAPELAPCAPADKGTHENTQAPILQTDEHAEIPR
jgi:hypothetical protein